MPVSVKVQTSARLHLGFLDLNGSSGRRFGSFGLAIDRPVTSLTIERTPSPRVEGPDHERIAAHLAALCRHLGLRASYQVKVQEAIPAHAGLGSGTQLALAVAAGLRRLERLPADTSADALLLQRGLRSGIGAALFSSGGLVVDGGHGANTGLPPVTCHLPFPKDWRIILVMDHELEGVHGEREREAFANLPSFPTAAAADICYRLLMQALPALVEHDLSQFGDAVSHIQTTLGDYFAPAQGGHRYTSPRVAAAMADLERHGAKGIGQSSWGPTGFAFAASDDEAQRLIRVLQEERRPREKDEPSKLSMLVCKGINHGAKVDMIADAQDLRRGYT
jgi:beta-ribofuranosylaminobenzene 5'-phosphate synthase